MGRARRAVVAGVVLPLLSLPTPAGGHALDEDDAPARRDLRVPVRTPVPGPAPEAVPMPTVEPVAPGPVPLPLVEPTPPGPVPMPRVGARPEPPVLE